MLILGLLTGLAAALVTVVVVPPVARIAWSLEAIDYPSGRKQHDGSIPRLGGVAILAGIVAGAACGGFLAGPAARARSSVEELLLFAIALAAIFAVGVIDDLRSLSIWSRLIVQGLAASLLVAAGWSFQVLELPLVGVVHLGLLAPVISVLWIVGITNAINFLDGADGLASGVTAIIASSFLLLAVIHGQASAVLISAAMAGACLGFLYHNWSPAKIFMGDSGSLTLGFLLASVSLQSSLKTPAAIAIVVPILALGLPTIDTSLVMIVRFLQSPGHPVLRRFGQVFQADRRHLHHVMLHLGPQRSSIVLGIYAIATVFCLMAIAVAMSRNVELGLALLLVEISVIFLIRSFSFRARYRQEMLEQPVQIRRGPPHLEDLEYPDSAPDLEPVLALNTRSRQSAAQAVVWNSTLSDGGFGVPPGDGRVVVLLEPGIGTLDAPAQFNRVFPT